MAKLLLKNFFSKNQKAYAQKFFLPKKQHIIRV